jgi:2'-5' RNA ligase
MRGFIAVDVSSDIIAKVQNDVLLSAVGWNREDLKPVEPHNFHFTLIFLGEIGEDAIDMIIEKLSGFQFEPFTITYTGIGAFPNPAYARVVWVGVDSESIQRLTALSNGVVMKMSELGFKPDKPFSAHMTLLRSRGRPLNASYLSLKYQGRTFGSDRIEKVYLKKSELTKSGPVYSNVYTVEAKK